MESSDSESSNNERSGGTEGRGMSEAFQTDGKNEEVYERAIHPNPHISNLIANYEYAVSVNQVTSLKRTTAHEIDSVGC